MRVFIKYVHAVGGEVMKKQVISDKGRGSQGQCGRPHFIP